uniref:Fc receptor-like protein 5 isoform X2 n=1 Tax=Semicossyphus pulcher TaxID=241346 RepID=UPI0037E79CD5
MWRIRVLSVIYFTAVCAAQDPKDVTPVSREAPQTTILTKVEPTVYEPPVPSLQLQSTWLDVFPSEKVDFKCTVSDSSDWIFIWQRNKEQVTNSDPNVSVSPDGSILTITAASPAYSGDYSCKGQHKTRGVSTADSNPLKLTVHPNKPTPTVTQKPDFGEMFPSENVTFTCTVQGSSGWEYMWFHDGKEIQTSSSFTITIGHPHSGKYHCQAKRGPFLTEESTTTTLQVSDPPKPSMKLLTPWLDVFEEEVVAFGCEAEGLSDWSFRWYKDNKEIPENSELIIDEEGSLLNITEVSKADEGVYACEAHITSRGVSSEFSNTATVRFHDTPKPTLHKLPVFSPMYVGEKVNFTCNVNVSFGWEYQWMKNGKDESATSKSYSFRLGISDGGKYSCKATRIETTSTDISKEMQLHVLEFPIPPLTRKTQWLNVFPDESVQLKCGVNSSSGLTYTWRRDEQDIHAGDVSFDSNGATLSIKTASAAHAGRYTCRGHLKERSVSSNSSHGLTLKVYDTKPRVILTQDPDYEVMFPGESVSFRCHLNVSHGWEYRWNKDKTQIDGSGNKYQIKKLSTTDTGSYTCGAKRGKGKNVFFTDSSQAIGLQVEVNRPKPVLTQQPDVAKVYVGELVSFECEVGVSSGWGYLWYKDKVLQKFNSSRFTIKANSSDSGIYNCTAMRGKDNFQTEYSDGWTLLVSDIPVPSTKLKTPWLDVFPTENVSLTCVMDGSSDWMYTWYKDNRMVQADETISFDKDATTISIKSSVSHRGRYSCSAKLKSRSVDSSVSAGLTLSVYDTKPTAILTQKPVYNVMHTGDSVSFGCHINISSGWEYLVLKDSVIVHSGNNHTITSVATKHTGSYECQAKRGRGTVFESLLSQAVKLNVSERAQANIILLTGWSEVFSTDSLALECGVQDSQDMWNYTWFKDNKPVKEEHSKRYTVTPQNNPEQSQYTCMGIRNGRPSYSKTSEYLKTKNLLLKRRVLLSISGCLVFGIIAAFLACIILRVVRKPADDEDRPEEADLFLNMAQLKAVDVPCPLVEFITDAELKASSKEGDENGAICSETTPLPITSQEDLDVTAESPDATENNGGLVSFKQ